MVPSNARPTAAPISAPPVTLTKPCTLDAVPAIAPIRSIAIAEKFEPVSPKHAERHRQQDA